MNLITSTEGSEAVVAKDEIGRKDGFVSKTIMKKYRPWWAAVLAALVVSLPWPGQAAVRPDMLVTTDWLAENLEQASVKILHVAENDTNYKKEHIPGAQFLAWGDIATVRQGIPNEIPPAEHLTALLRRLGVQSSDRVVVYDEWAGMFAARAYVVLDYLGLGERVALLDGQWKKWKSEKRPLTSHIPIFTPSQFQPQLQTQVLIGLNAVQDLVWLNTHTDNTKTALIDARPAEQYAGQVADPSLPRPGHIPGAINVPWQDMIVSLDNPVLKPASEILALYKKAGVLPNWQLVTYCRTGGQASHAYFTLKYLGYSPILYDGSFVEWSSHPENPVEVQQ